MTADSVGSPPRTAPTEAMGVSEADRRFIRWFGESYDLGALHAVLATLAAERLDGDPVWLLLIGGSGDAKTETVQSAAGANAIVTSSISSAGALLSGSSKRERAKDATGGLLRRMGSSGVLVIKDVTSILSMNRDARAEVLAALREVYDGKWERNVGSDGGKSLLWTGRIAVIGAVTTAWDQAHAVISSMGDRFVLLRLDSTRDRLSKGRKAMTNIGQEPTMRAELAEVVRRVLQDVNSAPVELGELETNRLLRAADLVTRCRTAVEYDFRGDVIDAHSPEAPTRFLKQLTQLVRGACAIGMKHEDALNLAIRCARDSMPPLRLSILDCLGRFGELQVCEVTKCLSKPRTTVDRQLQSLQALGVLVSLERNESDDGEEPGKTVTVYELAKGIDPAVLALSPEMLVDGVSGPKKQNLERTNIPTDISGDRTQVRGPVTIPSTEGGGLQS